MSSEQFTSEENLRQVEEQLQNGARDGVNADEALQMIRTIKRLRRADRKRVAYEEAAGKHFFLNASTGLQELEDLAHNRVHPEKIDEGYFSWLAGELAGLSDEEWARVKSTKEG